MAMSGEPQQPCKTCGTCPTCGNRPAPYAPPIYPQWWQQQSPNIGITPPNLNKLIVTTDKTAPYGDNLKVT